MPVFKGIARLVFLLVFVPLVQAEEQVLDNDAGGSVYSDNFLGTAATYTPPGEIGLSARVSYGSANGTKAAWSFTAVNTGAYQVWAAWPLPTTLAGTYSTTAPYAIAHDGGSAAVTANHAIASRNQSGADAEGYLLLGEYNFTAGLSYSVELSNTVNARVTADAVKIVFQDQDGDSDGMLDSFEDTYGLNKNDPADAAAHNDADSLTNLEEFLLGTDPTDPDTDNDASDDDVDVFPLDFSEWLDTDNDGIGNNADDNDDNDSLLDGDDPFPLDANKPAYVQNTVHEYFAKSSGDDFGISIDELGDVNGDGYGDFIIGSKAEYIQVYSGLDGVFLYEQSGPNFSNFGQVVANVGDIDGDLINDYAVGAPITKQVFVYSGAAANAANPPLFTWSGGDYYGGAIDGVGDYNNDNIPDVLIGAKWDDTSASDGGRVEVRSGADGAILFEKNGSNVNGYLGSAVAGLGDLKGDGIMYFAFKVYTPSTGHRSIVHVYRDVSTSPYRTIDGNYGYTFGYTLANLGDLNGDGENELGFGNVESGPGSRGAIWMYSVSDREFLDSVSGETYSRAGYSIDGAGDINGDGRGDFLLSLSRAGSGKVWLLSGANNSLIFEFTAKAGDSEYGHALKSLGDVNNDGDSDFIIGAHDSGRVEFVTLALDSDADGFSDRDEVDVFGTDPMVEDMDVDGDGLPNAYDTDDDNDGISDVDEVANGTDPTVIESSERETDLVISPAWHRFGQEAIGVSDCSGHHEVIYEVVNTDTSSRTLSAASIIGPYASEFQITENNCNTTLNANDNCRVKVVFCPQSEGAKAAMLSIDTNDAQTPKLRTALFTAEAAADAARRRLLPVLTDVTITDDDNGNAAVIDGLLVEGGSYTVTWQATGYHENYTMAAVLFNCEGISDGSCGQSYGGGYYSLSPIISNPVKELGEWTYGSVYSNKFTYSYSFTAPTVSADSDLVLRLYQRSDIDGVSGYGSLSLMIPGGLKNVGYYGVSGRRVSFTVQNQ